MMKTAFFSITMAIALLLLGCLFTAGSNGSDQRIALETVYSGVNCPARGTQLGVQWFARPAELPALSGASVGMPAASRIRWDPKSHGVLWISMGHKPTGGYGIELTQPAATVNKDTATVHIRLHRPPSGALVTQAFTSPCLLVKMATAGIAKIHIEDQTGRRLARIELPAR